MFKSEKYNVSVSCVYSESEYKKICDDYGFDSSYCENEPVGNKINQGIKETLKFDYDYLMIMNSDSVIKSELVDKYYAPFFESLNPYFGINRVTYVNFYTRQAKDYTYDYSVLGCGKCLHRTVVEKSFDLLGEVYPSHLSRCLDDKMLDNMLKLKVFPTMVRYDGQLAFDFKSEVNIHPWEKFKNGKDVTGQITSW